MHDRPAPNSAKPATAPTGSLLVSPAARLVAASNPQPRTRRTGPKRAASRSPSSRPTVIAIENAANPDTARPAGVPRLSRR